MKSLTENDILNYRTNGYLIKRSVFDREEISNIAKWIEKYQNRKADDWAGKENAYYAKKKWRDNYPISFFSSNIIKNTYTTSINSYNVNSPQSIRYYALI